MTAASVIPLAASLLYFLLFAFSLRIRRRVNRIFSGYLLTMGLWACSSLMWHVDALALADPPWLQAGLFFGIIAWMLMSTLSVVVLGLDSVPVARAGLWIAYSLGGILLIGDLGGKLTQVTRIEGSHFDIQFGNLIYLLFALTSLSSVGFAVLLTRASLKTGDHNQRNRLLYIAISHILVLVGGFANIPQQTRSLPFDILFSMVSALLMAYAIHRYQLLSLTLVIRKGLAYSAVTASIAATYLLTIFVFERLFRTVLGYGAYLIPILAAVIVAVAFQPLRGRAETWIDRLFFREKYDAGLMLQTLSRTAASILDLDVLSGMLLEEVTTTMHMAGACILLKDHDSGEFSLTTSNGLSEDVTDLRLRKNHPLLRRMAQEGNVLTVDEVDRLPEFKALWEQEREDLKRLSADLFVPLLVKGDLVGLLAFGPKLSEETYSRDDITTLATLANQTAVAIENARLYQAAQQEVAERKHAEALARVQRDLAVSLSATVDLDHALRQCTEVAISVSAMDSGSVYLVNASSGGLDLAFTQGLDAHAVEGAAHLSAGSPYTRLVMVGEPVYTRYEEMGLPFDETQRETRPRAVAIVPMQHEGQVIACLIVASHTLDEVPLTVRNTLQAIAAQMTNAFSRLRAEKALLESEERYRHVNENIQDVIYSLDAEGKIVFMSGACETLLGVPAQSLVGSDLLEAMIDRDPSGQYAQHIVHTYMEALKERKETIQYEVAMGRGGDKTLFLEVRERVRYDSEGTVANAFGVIRDISERKHAEEEKRDLEQKLERAQRMEALGVLAGGVAHDLNNILGPLVAYPDLILMDLPAESPIRDDVVRIQQAADRAAAEVQDLLTLARRGVYQMTSLSVNTVINAYVRSPSYTALATRNPNIAVDMDLDPHLLYVNGSAPHLSKVIMNLVSNAVEAMPHGGRLTIRTRSQSLDYAVDGYEHIEAGDFVVLQVSDTGVGIDSEYLDQIFEPFFTRKEMGRSGTGLGLAIVYGVVHDHDGRIDVKTEVGRGTDFIVYLPVARNLIREADVESDDYRGTETVLVVDDLRSQRDLAVRLLSLLGYKVSAVEGGRAAVEFIKENQADILVLDMILEDGFDGLDAYRQIIEFRSGQRAIIASGFSETERVKEAQQLGAGQFVKKPYTLDAIGRAVRHELDRKETHTS